MQAGQIAASGPMAVSALGWLRFRGCGNRGLTPVPQNPSPPLPEQALHSLPVFGGVEPCYTKPRPQPLEGVEGEKHHLTSSTAPAAVALVAGERLTC